jgi:3,4-dihydroxy-2-butanone 4-phosphate synthase
LFAAVATSNFATDKEFRLLVMHAQGTVCDATFKTNSQKKELFTIAFHDGNDEAFNGG